MARRFRTQTKASVAKDRAAGGKGGETDTSAPGGGGSSSSGGGGSSTTTSSKKFFFNPKTGTFSTTKIAGQTGVTKAQAQSQSKSRGGGSVGDISGLSSTQIRRAGSFTEAEQKRRFGKVAVPQKTTTRKGTAPSGTLTLAAQSGAGAISQFETGLQSAAPDLRFQTKKQNAGTLVMAAGDISKPTRDQNVSDIFRQQDIIASGGVPKRSRTLAPSLIKETLGTKVKGKVQTFREALTGARETAFRIKSEGGDVGFGGGALITSAQFIKGTPIKTQDVDVGASNIYEGLTLEEKVATQKVQSPIRIIKEKFKGGTRFEQEQITTERLDTSRLTTPSGGQSGLESFATALGIGTTIFSLTGSPTDSSLSIFGALKQKNIATTKVIEKGFNILKIPTITKKGAGTFLFKASTSTVGALITLDVSGKVASLSAPDTTKNIVDLTPSAEASIFASGRRSEISSVAGEGNIVSKFFRGTGGVLAGTVVKDPTAFESGVTSRATELGFSSDQIDLITQRQIARRPFRVIGETISLLEPETFANVFGGSQFDIAKQAGKIPVASKGIVNRIKSGIAIRATKKGVGFGEGFGSVLTGEFALNPDKPFFGRFTKDKGTQSFSSFESQDFTNVTKNISRKEFDLLNVTQKTPGEFENLIFKVKDKPTFETKITETPEGILTETFKTQNITEERFGITRPGKLGGVKFQPGKFETALVGGAIGEFTGRTIGFAEGFFEAGFIGRTLTKVFSFSADAAEGPGDFITPAIGITGTSFKSRSFSPSINFGNQFDIQVTPTSQTQQTISQQTLFDSSFAPSSTKTLDSQLGLSVQQTKSKSNSFQNQFQTQDQQQNQFQNQFQEQFQTQTQEENQFVNQFENQFQEQFQQENQFQNQFQTQTVFSTKLPFPLIPVVLPGGGGGGGGFNFGSRSFRGTRFAPSLLGIQRVKTRKGRKKLKGKRQGDLLTGLGVRLPAGF